MNTDLTPEQEQMLDEELLFLQTTQALNMKHNTLQPLTQEQFTADLAKDGCYDPLGELYESYLECRYNASKAIYQ